MAYINSIATAVPAHCHDQKNLLGFMKQAYKGDPAENRKLSFLYRQSQIEHRYSVIPDFSQDAEDWTFFRPEAGNAAPSLEDRMDIYFRDIVPLARKASESCLENIISPREITHLITISCTGLAAPGLDLMLMEAMDLSPATERSSVNFMGCYAAVHGMKQAQYICASEPGAKVLVVCAELCTLHFQEAPSEDNIASSLLFADGAAAILMSNEKLGIRNVEITGFHSYVELNGKEDMAWTLGKTGFLMRLSSYIPQLIEAGITDQVMALLQKSHLNLSQIHHWCIHPGGKKILELIEQRLSLSENALSASREVLRNYGNMSSPTVLFVLKELVERHAMAPGENIFGAAFGPGLTMEMFTAKAC